MVVEATAGVRRQQLVVVTGATGFVGQRLITRLAADGARVIAMSRRPRPSTVEAGVTWLTADLCESEGYSRELAGVDAVLHLAGETGKAPAAAFHRGIVVATRNLLAACEQRRVPRFVFVSSIAATFTDQRHYHYAQAKAHAESIVRASSIPWVIVRPTMILGPGSPIEVSLDRLAGLPLVPLFGGGSRLVQPISVDAVVEALRKLVSVTCKMRCEIDLGGPEVITMRALLLRQRAAMGLSGAPTLHIPLAPLRFLLSVLEGSLLRFLPFTAGQLAAFANDSVVLAQHSPCTPLVVGGDRMGFQSTRQ